MRTVDLTCGFCGSPFTRSVAKYQAALKRGARIFCSRDCLNNEQKKQVKVFEGVCPRCGSQFRRQARGWSDKGLCCSARCGIAYSNGQRRKKRPTCLRCNAIIPRGRADYPCRNCAALDSGARTLGAIRATHGTHGFHAVVRSHARASYKGPKECAACGYTLHVEVCHVRNVADFESVATLSQVNAPSNLVALDKRCHWEFDHGYLHCDNGRFLATVPD